MSRSRSREFAGWVVALALATIATVPANAQNPYRLKPGARGQSCLACHVTFEETLGMSSVHTPVRSGECTGCHSPHAAAHGSLLAVSPEQVCLGCHEGLVPPDPRSAHAMVVSGDCVACHDPHASEHENVLIADGNQLCATCHAEIAEQATGAKFGHSPVEQGCVTCHDPHASAESGFLLTAAEPSLCVTCHDPARASFGQQHMGYPVGDARCTSCHDPHGSDSGGMLWASAHRPITNKMCSQCHNSPSAPNALATKQSGAELCRGCHSTMLNEMALKDRLHWPIADAVSCQHCHSPHASQHAGLLLDRPVELCGDCHGDTIARQQRSLTKHQPVNDGECSACHDPHAANGAFLLVEEDEIALCATCHEWEAHSTHPIGDTVLDMRNANLGVDCSSCHRNHGTEFKHFSPLDPDSELCVDCHETLRR